MILMAPDGLSSSMIEAILRFKSESEPVELHHSTKEALLRRGILVRATSKDSSRPWGVYPTTAGMVMAGVVHALWHVTKALIDAKLSPEAQSAAVRKRPVLPLPMIVDTNEFTRETWGAIIQTLEGVTEAYNPNLGRKAFEPPLIDLLRAASQLVRKPKAEPETDV